MTPRERPILFSVEMVRALLAGRKTQTRRVVKPQPFDVDAPWPNERSCLTWADVLGDPVYYIASGHCPYGAPGDRLWARETWRKGTTDSGLAVEYAADLSRRYLDDYPDQSTDWYWLPDMSWRPSIHMPRWASRSITLVITNIRAERLQDITHRDILAEGIGDAYKAPEQLYPTFAALWNSINARRGYLWASNPWVWVVEFRRVQP